MSYQPIDIQSLFQQALEQYNNKDYAASLPYCQLIIAQFPQDFNALQLTGINHYQLGDIENAIEWLERALSIDSTKPQLFNSLACAYRDFGHIEQAVAYYQHALDLSPEYSIALCNLGELYIKLDRVFEAIPLLIRTCASNPDDTMMQLKLAECYALTKNYENAINIVSLILQNDPAYPGAHTLLANYSLQAGDFRQAETIYRQQIAEEPTNAGAWNNLGALYEKQELWQEAKDCFIQSIKSNPALASAHANLAHSYLMLNEAELSIQSGIRAIELKPDFASVSLTIATASKQLGDITNAEAYLVAELERDNRFSSAWYNLGNLYRETGRFDEAIECYENTLLIDPEHADAELNLGLALLTLGQFGKGFRHYFKRPRILTSNTRLSPIIPGQQFTGKRILLLRAQGIGDELLFLRFTQQLKNQGAWIAYQANEKLVPVLQGIENLDLVIAESVAPPDCDFTFAIDDLPLLLDIQSADQIPPSIRLKTRKSIEQRVSTHLLSVSEGPYIAINWRAGDENKSTKDYVALSKTIPINEFARMIEHITGTFVIVQRNLKKEELEYLQQQF
ncbi:MAG: tetratricopeptide repeat protein, partial [Gammaproteobacteria bacterium]|nr:tetratricopeptide repeat protein [Gammaproteobacteria bacterium]